VWKEAIRENIQLICVLRTPYVTVHVPIGAHIAGRISRILMSWATAGLLSSLPSWVSRTASRRLFLGFILGVSFSWSFTAFKAVYQRRKEERRTAHYSPKPIELRSDEVVRGVTGLIGEQADQFPCLSGFYFRVHRQYTSCED